MGREYDGLFEDWEIAIARKLVHEFQEGSIWLDCEDPEDLTWECLKRWCFARDRYDPSRGASRLHNRPLR